VKPAPVILFCYNRPDLVEQTLRSLSVNELSKETPLHVFCDGPREDASAETLERISSVRRIVRSQSW
jgi:hypothetical protein